MQQARRLRLPPPIPASMPSPRALPCPRPPPPPPPLHYFPATRRASQHGLHGAAGAVGPRPPRLPRLPRVSGGRAGGWGGQGSNGTVHMLVQLVCWFVFLCRRHSPANRRLHPACLFAQGKAGGGGSSANVAALELVAMDMKAQGMYVCRTLSFAGECTQFRPAGSRRGGWLGRKHCLQGGVAWGPGRAPRLPTHAAHAVSTRHQPRACVFPRCPGPAQALSSRPLRPRWRSPLPASTRPRQQPGTACFASFWPRRRRRRRCRRPPRPPVRAPA